MEIKSSNNDKLSAMDVMVESKTPNIGLLKKATNFMEEKYLDAIFIREYENYIPQNFIQSESFFYCNNTAEKSQKKVFNEQVDTTKTTIRETEEGLFEIVFQGENFPKDKNFDLLVKKVLHKI